MDDVSQPRFSLLVIALILAGLGEARAQVVIDSDRHHLGTAGEPEWQEFAESEPEGSVLELHFEAQANADENTLLIRQCGVKLRWDVTLNDQTVGRLLPIESALVHALAIPPGTLRDGPNRLTIGPPPGADDIIIDQVALDPRPLRVALDRSTLEVVVTDADAGIGLPARITIVDERDVLAPLVVEPESRLAARPGVVYSPDGHARIGLPPGRYTVHATRGFEYGLDSREVVLDEGQQRRVELAIRREVPTPGLVACDTHTHTLTHSGHGDATIDERVVTLAGEGIELPVATDHDFLTDLDPVARRLGVRSYFTPVVGSEITTRAGHFNAFPFPIDAQPPDSRITDWPRLLEAIRATPGVQIVVLNHPRDVHAGFRPFDPEHFHPVTGAHQRVPKLGVDALEVLNSGALQSDPLLLLSDWMALLNRGERITAVAGSDSHDVSRFIVGQGRNYIACDDDDPAAIDIEAACYALREGRATISLGLLVHLTVDERFEVGDIATDLGEELRVTVRVLGPSWTTADHVALYANGLPIQEQRIEPSTDAGVKAEITWTLPRPSHDVHLVAIAAGPGVTAPYWPIPRPYQPTTIVWEPRVLGATNPIYVDADGDGAWTSARAYAEAVIGQVGTDPTALLPVLGRFDPAVSAQAAEISQSRGLDVRAEAFTSQLESAAEPVRQGFAAYAARLEGQP